MHTGPKANAPSKQRHIPEGSRATPLDTTAVAFAMSAAVTGSSQPERRLRFFSSAGASLGGDAARAGGVGLRSRERSRRLLRSRERDLDGERRFGDLERERSWSDLCLRRGLRERERERPMLQGLTRDYRKYRDVCFWLGGAIMAFSSAFGAVPTDPRKSLYSFRDKGRLTSTMAPQSSVLPCNLATTMVSKRLSVVANNSPRSQEARKQQIVPWIRRPRFMFESWPSDEEEDDESDYRCVYNPYAVLGLAPDPRPVHVALTCPTSKAEIHNAYLELSKRLHPDCRNAAAERR